MPIETNEIAQPQIAEPIIQIQEKSTSLQNTAGTKEQPSSDPRSPDENPLITKLDVLREQLSRKEVNTPQGILAQVIDMNELSTELYGKRRLLEDYLTNYRLGLQALSSLKLETKVDEIIFTKMYDSIGPLEKEISRYQNMNSVPEIQTQPLPSIKQNNNTQEPSNYQDTKVGFTVGIQKTTTEPQDQP